MSCILLVFDAQLVMER